MRYSTTLLFLAVASTSSLYSPAQAAEPERSTVAVATNTGNPVFEYSARKVLGYVSEARVAIGNEQKETATAYLDEAIKELEGIRNTRDYLDMMGTRFGRVLYGESNSYYIPVADDTYAVRTYTHGPFWRADKTTAVKDVELVNVDIAINPEKSTSHLQTAKEKVAGNDYKAADKELKDMLDESIHATTASDQPFTRLQDNVYLTRILLRQENYDGARYTLKHAKSALNDYEKSLSDSDSRANATAMRVEIDTLDQTIKDRDPTMLSKASEKVERWWTELKTWTKQKTS